MSAKLEKMAAELKRLCKKRDEYDTRIKDMEAKYREQENTEIHDIVHAANLTPEELAALLANLANGIPGAVNPQETAAQDSTEESAETAPESDISNDNNKEDNDIYEIYEV